ncbi:MAG: ComEC/Rec2 family competence protein [Arcobacter sp.]|nr:ComEC/Rec2 family competence protein [Arcobacter sp.]
MTKIVANKKDLRYFILIISFIFLLNIIYEFQKYKDFIEEEVYSDIFTIINIYDKKDFYILKLQNSNFNFFTSIQKETNLQKFDKIDLVILTINIDFLSFLKGFYTKSLFYEKILEEKTFKQKISNYINNTHKDIRVQELFNALFLAIPISNENREIYSNFGINHLIAISGFHLGIIVFIIYCLVHLPYSFFHQRYFPYRNKSYDILIFSVVILYFYLLLTNVVPSLLRSFIMFIIGIFLLRRNIKLLSFMTLFLTFCLVLALFPRFCFSISFWFSIIGVFYIFLYIKYFKNLPKLFSFLFFNIWIFFVFNPIVHYFFYNTSYEQMLSALITLLFTIFYPLELFVHIIGYSSILDKYIVCFLEYDIAVYDFETSLYFFILYILVSLLSVFKKSFFIFLNILLLLFNIFLYK